MQNMAMHVHVVVIKTEEAHLVRRHTLHKARSAKCLAQCQSLKDCYEYNGLARQKAELSIIIPRTNQNLTNHKGV